MLSIQTVKMRKMYIHFYQRFDVLCSETTLNMYVVYFEKRLVSNVLVWFERVISYVINEFLRCYTYLLCFIYNNII